MGNIEAHDFAPVRADERKILNLSRKVTPKQYVKHLHGEVHEACLTELPWNIRDSVSLYEAMTAAFNALTEIPVELPLRLPHLSRVDLSHNQLQGLPESFGLLFHLKEIHLEHNKLHSLPESFVHLVKLEKIDLSYNELRSLPEDIGDMERLGRLSVVHNKLKQLPLSLGCPSCPVHLLLAQQNRLESPPQAVCDEGSSSTLEYLRKQYTTNYNEIPSRPATPLNQFPRCCNNKLEPSVANPHSAQIQYIQEQTDTAHVTSRIKVPLLPPLDATTLTPFQLRDRVIGLIYGAAIGDAIGVACRWMSDDECSFHYNFDDDLIYSRIVQDEHRVLWRQGDWTSNFDQFVLVLDSLVNWGGVVDELEFGRRLLAWVERGFPDLGDSAGVVTSDTIAQAAHHESFTRDPHWTSSAILEKNKVTQNGDLSNHISSHQPVSPHIEAEATGRDGVAISPAHTDTEGTGTDAVATVTLTNVEVAGTDSVAGMTLTNAEVTGGDGVVMATRTDSVSKDSPSSPSSSQQHVQLKRLSSTSSSLPSLTLCSHTEVAQKLVYMAPCREFGVDNGAIVRTAILGVPNFHELHEVEGNAVRICRATHADRKCVASCVLVSLLIATLLQGQLVMETDDQKRTVNEELLDKLFQQSASHITDSSDKEEFLSLRNCKSFSNFDARAAYAVSHTYTPLKAALIALYWPDDYRSFITVLTKMAGDSNSNACVAGAVLGAVRGYSLLTPLWLTDLRKRQVTWLNKKVNHLLDIMGAP
ncbi:uncharacterized protein LOC101861361 [Aplysia californica]|uniref:Uncharacterized protein LOC101861361 n=1 Tax=Aplysia californica TaxID=6500 RepID=A0ABM0JMU4_APLCA|nr:uncharacterized protein LOC101861361 [Aplysia californica]